MAAKKKPGLFTRKVTKRPAKASRPRAPGDEPEELRLWRQIIAYRDVLEKSAASWANFLAVQRRAHERRAIDKTPAAKRISERSDQVLAGVAEKAEAARHRVLAFDAAIESLRDTTSGAYALSKLEKVAESFQADLLTDARARVYEFIIDPSDHAKLQAQAALAVARDTAPRVIDTQAEVNRILQAREEQDPGDLVAAAMWPERIQHDIDLDALLAEARKTRFAKNESGKVVARRVVASALGLNPHERKLRR